MQDSELKTKFRSGHFGSGHLTEDLNTANIVPVFFDCDKLRLPHFDQIQTTGVHLVKSRRVFHGKLKRNKTGTMFRTVESH